MVHDDGRQSKELIGLDNSRTTKNMREKCVFSFPYGGERCMGKMYERGSRRV